MFKVGQKIVCVSHFENVYINSGRCDNKPVPIVDFVYVSDGMHSSGLGVYIHELNYASISGGRVSFNVLKFRPLDELLREISIAELETSLTTELCQ